MSHEALQILQYEQEKAEYTAWLIRRHHSASAAFGFHWQAPTRIGWHIHTLACVIVDNPNYPAYLNQ